MVFACHCRKLRKRTQCEGLMKNKKKDYKRGSFLRFNEDGSVFFPPAGQERWSVSSMKNSLSFSFSPLGVFFFVCKISEQWFPITVACWEEIYRSNKSRDMVWGFFFAERDVHFPGSHSFFLCFFGGWEGGDSSADKEFSLLWLWENIKILSCGSKRCVANKTKDR